MSCTFIKIQFEPNWGELAIQLDLCIHRQSVPGPSEDTEIHRYANLCISPIMSLNATAEILCSHPGLFLRPTEAATNLCKLQKYLQRCQKGTSVFYKNLWGQLERRPSGCDQSTSLLCLRAQVKHSIAGLQPTVTVVKSMDIELESEPVLQIKGMFSSIL